MVESIKPIDLVKPTENNKLRDVLKISAVSSIVNEVGTIGPTITATAHVENKNLEEILKIIAASKIMNEVSQINPKPLTPVNSNLNDFLKTVATLKIMESIQPIQSNESNIKSKSIEANEDVVIKTTNYVNGQIDPLIDNNPLIEVVA